MPKLAKKAADRVAEAESNDFSALPEGTYRARLDEVEVREGKTSGAPYWSWAFTVTEEGDQEGRKLWVNTSLSEKADWKMKEVFDAFGYSTDSDTDEMIGDEVLLVVTQRVIEQGARSGQMGNNVDLVLALEPGEGEASGTGDGPEEDDVF